MINIGIIGAGRIGRVHAESIAYGVKGAKVVAIAEPNLTEDVIKWAKTLNIDKCVKDYKELLGDNNIDAVLICSSTDTHSVISIDAINAKKHVFCEKPIDHDVNKILQVKEALDNNKEIKYQVGFNRRFDHNFMAAKEAVLSGKIGDINVVKITSRDPGPPPVSYIKVSGGLFLDMAIHDFDMVRFISGAEVIEVFAYGANLVDPLIGEAGDIDTAVVSMKLSNKALAVIDNCRRSSYGYDQRLEVFGSIGQVSVGNDTKANITLSNTDGVTSEKPLHFFLERYMEAYSREVNEFIEAIICGNEITVGLNDGLMDVVVGLAAKQSLKSGMPVKIEDILKQYGL